MAQSTRLQDYPLASHTVPRGSATYQIPKRLKRILSLDDFEAVARRHLPKPIFAYVSGGSEKERSLIANRIDFDHYEWIGRAFTDTSKRSLETTVLGHRYSAPFGIAPMGISGLTAFEGDLIQTRAAAEANIPAIMSGSSLLPMEKILQANPDAWFQAYVPGEEEKIIALLERVGQAGFKTLVVTADVPVSANRENLIRARFSTPLKPDLYLAWEGLTHPRWLIGTALRTLLRHGMPHFENSGVKRGAPIMSANVMRDFGARDHLSWEHLKLIRERWKGTLVVKGILDPVDARKAVEAGVDGIIVSNHGGRQLDGCVSPISVLPEIVKAVGPQYPVMIDSGFRRGTDILVALALGAKFVFIGRPMNYAGAVGGQPGIKHAIGILATELSRNMALLGVLRPGDVSHERLRKRHSQA
ncbi:MULTISPECIES: alpha-hydroxy acid oxidase [Pseudomonas]|uniref:alpha-hydroxy acid oxidase n=1 Tax=Pseudomonas TaxID=286 RepID=UPI002A36F53B|nr:MULTISPECIES: alpha-hydroxy acid oxidase [Pseudomonas]MEB0107053.1 alpha-hydroxy acid oxidase [Pseudomonas sp. MH9.3]WPN21669.1 alpha-hydroxy acid oxidase [Pseudomonas marginalis]WPX80330.1 alpha-hydroxy acid oxidase [Pseudomonas sp. MH9.3]